MLKALLELSKKLPYVRLSDFNNLTPFSSNDIARIGTTFNSLKEELNLPYKKGRPSRKEGETPHYHYDNYIPSLPKPKITAKSSCLKCSSIFDSPIDSRGIPVKRICLQCKFINSKTARFKTDTH